MDYIIVAGAIFVLFIALKIMKSAFKFVLTIGIIAFIVYFLDIQGFIDIAPFLDSLGI
ncbi:MAG: hypothetical protein GX829_05495 [Clostridium sp.]|nr:hypothetical protein [Clostridium sp.]